jgi:L-2,4-diaminobutyrate decarboxylase
VLCHGGTLGNLVALMAAQRKVAQDMGLDSWQGGIRAFPQPLVVLVSERAHYCIDRAMRTMGWGAEGTVLVQTNEKHQMRVDDLHAQIERVHHEGKRVLAVVGSSCTTSAGAYDPLEDLAAACRQHGIWFHVDGAHGASTAFSDAHRHLVKGIEHADSVVLDFHKTCGIPALCTGVFYARHAESFLPFSQHAEYLWDDANDLDWWDTGKRTFECTKRMLSTRLAAIKAEFGWGIWGELVDRMWALGQALASMIEDRPGWELAMAPQANIVCFRPDPNEDISAERWNEVVRVLRKCHLAEGSGYVVQTEFEGKVWLRCTLMNPLTEEADLVHMLDEFESLLPSVLKSMAVKNEADPRMEMEAKARRQGEEQN